MDKTIEKLTVFFENPFWVGIFERIPDGKLYVCKVTFGSEPKDYEVLEFILRNYNNLSFSDGIAAEVKKTSDNPKRRQREAKKQINNIGVGTKWQQALKLQHEEFKALHKQISKHQREIEKQRKFDLKQQKRKEKHKGH